MKTIIQWLSTVLRSLGRQRWADVEAKETQPSVPLEHQLETLGRLGLQLNDGVTVDDLLQSWDRQEYETSPYDTLLFMLGSEVERAPWGRTVCDRAWNCDFECIEGEGSYVAIVENLCRVADMPDLVANLEDSVDIEHETAWLQYTIRGETRRFDIPINHDWADVETIRAVMRDIERDGKRFYGKDNGQATIWFYLDKETADDLNTLTGNALTVGG